MMARTRRRHAHALLQPFSRLESVERDWAHHHDDGLSCRAARAMQAWKQTLSRRQRASIGEPMMHERVAAEMKRSRRMKAGPMRSIPPDGFNDSGDGMSEGATTGLHHSATAVRKAKAGWTAEFSGGRKQSPNHQVRTPADADDGSRSSMMVP